MEILIVGDSFADLTGISGDTWYNQLPGTVTNLSQAGVGQYKILQQLKGTSEHYDVSLVLITSEYRVHAAQNPFYTDTSHRHHRSDLIFADIESRLPDTRAQHLSYWFKNIFDSAYAVDVHNLLLKETHRILQERKQRFIPITFFPKMPGAYDFDGKVLDLSSIAQKYPGDRNHLSADGHKAVLQRIRSMF